HHRELRTGQAEAVYAPGKTPEEVRDAALALVRRASGAVFVTRADHEQVRALRAAIPGADYDERSRLVVVQRATPNGHRLGTVAAGLTSRPVVAVPTSVGYGASFRGLAALLTMLASCAPGVAVVNIDNGFGAALVAHRILRAGPGGGA